MELNLTDITYDLEKAGTTLMAGLGVNARDGLKELLRYDDRPLPPRDRLRQNTVQI